MNLDSFQYRSNRMIMKILIYERPAERFIRFLIDYLETNKGF